VSWIGEKLSQPPHYLYRSLCMILHHRG
jgi:hypothetical protein